MLWFAHVVCALFVLLMLVGLVGQQTVHIYWPVRFASSPIACDDWALQTVQVSQEMYHVWILYGVDSTSYMFSWVVYIYLWCSSTCLPIFHQGKFYIPFTYFTPNHWILSNYWACESFFRTVFPWKFQQRETHQHQPPNLNHIWYSVSTPQKSQNIPKRSKAFH